MNRWNANSALTMFAAIHTADISSTRPHISEVIRQKSDRILGKTVFRIGRQASQPKKSPIVLLQL